MNKNQIVASVAGGALVLGSLGGVVALNRTETAAAVDPEPISVTTSVATSTADGVVEQVDYQVEIVDDSPAAATAAESNDVAGYGEAAESEEAHDEAEEAHPEGAGDEHEYEDEDD